MRLMRKLSDMIVYIGKQKMYPLLIVFFLGIAFFFILGQLYYSVRKKRIAKSWKEHSKRFYCDNCKKILLKAIFPLVNGNVNWRNILILFI